MATSPGENARPNYSSLRQHYNGDSPAGQENTILTPQGATAPNPHVYLGYNTNDSDEKRPALIASPSDEALASHPREHANAGSASTLGMFLPPFRTSSLRAQTSPRDAADATAAARVLTMGGMFRLRTFSFEGEDDDKENDPNMPVPSPVPSMSEEALAPDNGRPVLTEIDVVNDNGLGGQGFRSPSSSYPSEGGARSPELTVSPPMTFGRRLLSSLESFGFGNPHMESLTSELALSEGGVRSDGQLSVGAPVDNSGAGTEENIKLGGLQEASPPAPAPTPAAVEDTPSTTNTDTVRRHIILPDLYESENESTDDGNMDPNISTRCLPRFSMDPAQAAAALANDGFEDIDLRPSTSKRSGVSTLKQRLAGMSVLSPVKVKKWFVRRYRASRRGSREIVDRVGRRRKARMSHKFAEKKSKGKKVVGNTDSKRVGSRRSVTLTRMFSLLLAGGEGEKKGEKKEVVEA
ncbi:hypothetical protein B0T18DRAFT_156134 [Schizothecium vesticola]|uniref:Uncharacterized protein n=1 Tax=Schizothecium vesticola TaxID=314040 RepID=A0AA40K5V5_9PEZI|nr:hypothetical protein B0T18DRAFT_156134 [Schizothecium vesticola]